MCGRKRHCMQALHRMHPWRRQEGHKKVTQGGKQYAPGESGKDDKRKKAVRFFRLSFTHGLCYKGAAACAEHESDTRENHDGGEDQVDRGECRLAHIVRYEKSVDHGVGGNKDHHHHGGQDETEKLFIIETGRNICVHIYFDNLKTKKIGTTSITKSSPQNADAFFVVVPL